MQWRIHALIVFCLCVYHMSRMTVVHIGVCVWGTYVHVGVCDRVNLSISVFLRKRMACDWLTDRT